MNKLIANEKLAKNILKNGNLIGDVVKTARLYSEYPCIVARWNESGKTMFVLCQGESVLTYDSNNVTGIKAGVKPGTALFKFYKKWCQICIGISDPFAQLVGFEVSFLEIANDILAENMDQYDAILYIVDDGEIQIKELQGK